MVWYGCDCNTDCFNGLMSVIMIAGCGGLLKEENLECMHRYGESKEKVSTCT